MTLLGIGEKALPKVSAFAPTDSTQALFLVILTRLCSLWPRRNRAGGPDDGQELLE
jgi:hypothetical protein